MITKPLSNTSHHSQQARTMLYHVSQTQFLFYDMCRFYNDAFLAGSCGGCSWNFRAGLLRRLGALVSNDLLSTVITTWLWIENTSGDCKVNGGNFETCFFLRMLTWLLNTTGVCCVSVLGRGRGGRRRRWREETQLQNIWKLIFSYIIFKKTFEINRFFLSSYESMLPCDQY